MNLHQTKNSKPDNKYFLGLCIAAMGVAYGDLGTSVLYSIRVSFDPQFGLDPTEGNILGILSLIFWALIVVVCIKYMIFVLRADSEGEGGILVLTSLLSSKGKNSKRRRILILIGLFGSALLYGDSTITPAITVLSSVEGLKQATTVFQPYIIPITVGILAALFFFQYKGTAKIGRVFGPVMLVWFLSIAILGVSHIIKAPQVLTAVNPLYAIHFFERHGLGGVIILGSVVLCLTGTEALYADMGHFGKKPIRFAWFFLIFPAVTCCYFGEGAVIISQSGVFKNPFFSMAPGWMLYPLVALATTAAIIASQSVITGAFSLARQSVLFGDLPRMTIRQTSTKKVGQIYVPTINWILMVLTITLVISFGSSSGLAGAYGVAVTGTMVITSILFADVMYRRWKWNLFIVIFLTIIFLSFDIAFFAGNIPKIPYGGWFPILIASIVLLLMTTWRKGRRIIKRRIMASHIPIEKFLKNIKEFTQIDHTEIKRIEGTAIYMYSNPEGTPPALINNIKHNHIIHNNVVLLNIETSHQKPYIYRKNQIEIASLGNGFYKIVIYHGFAQKVNIPRILAYIDEPELEFDLDKSSFFLGTELIIAKDKKSFGMRKWQGHLFDLMARNQQRATTYFGLPSSRVIEVGAETEL